MSLRIASKLVCLGAVILCPGCGARTAVTSEGRVDASRKPTATIEIDGSSTVYPISRAVADRFKSRFPNVRVKVDFGGTSAGFRRFARGEIDVWDASRSIKPQELAECTSQGVDFLELPIAYDGLTIVVNQKNDWVDRLTLAQLRKIFLSDQAAKQWSEIDPNWPSLPIRLFVPGPDSGTFDYFKSVVAAEQSMRTDMAHSEDDNVLVQRIVENEESLGFFGAAYYLANRGRLKAIEIVDPETGEAVAPTADAIESGRYAPLSRPLFIYVPLKSLQKPAVADFIDFYLDHAPEVAAEVGYVALPPAIYDAAREHYRQRLAGTHFLDPQGDTRRGPLDEIYSPKNLSAGD